MGFVSVEIVVAGNLSFVYGSSYSYQNWYLNGPTNAALTQQVFDGIKAKDGDYYRCYNDGATGEVGNNGAWSFGYNGTSNFHSLYNFDVTQLCLYSGFKGNGYESKAYGQMVNHPSWSGFYGNKRYALDQTLGMRYYVIMNEGYGPFEETAKNVPFGSTYVEDLTNARYRVYKSPYTSSETGSYFARSVDKIYPRKEAHDEKTPNLDQFYKGTSDTKYGNGATYCNVIMRNEEVFLNHAIVEDDDVEGLKEKGFAITENAPSTDVSVSTPYKKLEYSRCKVTTISQYGYYASFTNDAGEKTVWDPGYFLSHLNDPTVVTGKENITAANSAHKGDVDKICLYPRGGVLGESYFNDEYDGMYFLMHLDAENMTRNMRVYFIGDYYDDDSNLVENAVLSYEFRMFRNFQSNAVTDISDLFGFYAPGRVKAIVFNAKGSSNYIMNWTGGSALNIYMYGIERSVLEAQNDLLRSRSVTDVEYVTDKFTFKSNYAEDSLVVTTLGYDAGWKVKGIDENGTKKDLPTYKLDGGLVGFFAPKGKMSYVMEYKTPYLILTTIAFALGGFGIIAVELAPFAIIYFKKKKGAKPGPAEENSESTTNP